MFLSDVNQNRRLAECVNAFNTLLISHSIGCSMQNVHRLLAFSARVSGFASLRPPVTSTPPQPTTTSSFNHYSLNFPSPSLSNILQRAWHGKRYRWNVSPSGSSDSLLKLTFAPAVREAETVNCHWKSKEDGLYTVPCNDRMVD